MISSFMHLGVSAAWPDKALRDMARQITLKLGNQLSWEWGDEAAESEARRKLENELSARCSLPGRLVVTEYLTVTNWATGDTLRHYEVSSRAARWEMTSKRHQFVRMLNDMRELKRVKSLVSPQSGDVAES